jgi:hypothetical protein
MPSATIFCVDVETGDPKPVGSLSYKSDETFADARLKLLKLGYFDFEFDFINVNLRSKMVVAWEKGNHLEDCQSKIIIIPKVSQCTGYTVQGQPFVGEIGSSNASNSRSVNCSHSEDVSISLTDNDWITEEPPIEDVPPVADVSVEEEEP